MLNAGKAGLAALMFGLCTADACADEAGTTVHIAEGLPSVTVLHQGRLSAARPAGDWTLADIGLAMAGSEAEHAH